MTLRDPTTPEKPRPGGLRSQLGWFVLLYCGSAVAFAAVVYGLRALVPR
jgi:hypothetical protein